MFRVAGSVSSGHEFFSSAEGSLLRQPCLRRERVRLRFLCSNHTNPVCERVLWHYHKRGASGRGKTSISGPVNGLSMVYKPCCTRGIPTAWQSPGTSYDWDGACFPLPGTDREPVGGLCQESFVFQVAEYPEHPCTVPAKVPDQVPGIRSRTFQEC